MSEKQLDFLHIFDQHPFDPEEEDLPEEDLAERETNDKEEMIRIEKTAEAEQRQREKKERLIALLKAFEPKVEDFDEFLPMIADYEVRMREIRTKYEQSLDHPQKMRLYEILVRPDLNDSVDYQETAKLYLKYKEAESQLLARQRAAMYTEMFKKRRPQKKKEKLKKAREIDLEHGKNAAARLAD